MTGPRSRFAVPLLYCLGAALVLQPVSAFAAVYGNEAAAFGLYGRGRDPQLVLVQAEPLPLLPSLVLPPDATGGPPPFVAAMRMGDSAVVHGNMAQARSLYDRAASIYPKSSAPFLAAGKTYDANVLSALGVNSRDFADPVKARDFYERARRLGDPSAAEFIARLPKSSEN